MSIRPPGARLFAALPFRFLARLGAGGASVMPSANIDLNLTPFVDMMTILVTFLLMVFSASGDIVSQQAGLELPVAGQQTELQRAPVIIITRQSITFNGEPMADVDSLLLGASTDWKIVELYERLKAERKLFEIGFDKLSESQKQRCKSGESGKSGKSDDGRQCERGLAILQADRSIKARILNRVIKTASAAGYGNLMFAVERQNGR